MLLNKQAQSPEESEEEYDPYIYREVEHPTSYVETLTHLLKGCIGTGILAMPEAFKLSGMSCGIVSTFLIGALCTYCLHVLVRSQYVLCKKHKAPLLTYPESMKVACEVGPSCLNKCAPYAPAVTNFFLIFYQIGICCIYVIFVGVNIKSVVDQYYMEINLTLYLLLLFVPFVLIMCIRNLKILAPFSILANIITFITFGVICYYVFQDLPNFSDHPSFGSLLEYPLYFGTTLFSIMAIGVIITLENNMATPENFRGTFGVLNVGMAIVVVIYVIIGMMGYWKYGENVEPSITLNFPPTDYLANTINILYSIAIYISYGLQGYVPVQIIYSDYLSKYLDESQHKLLWEYLLRLATVVLTFVLAATIPYLGIFISLVGAFSVSALGIAFPAIIELCAYWPDKLGPMKYILIKDIMLILVGAIGLLSGLFCSGYSFYLELYKTMYNED